MTLKTHEPEERRWDSVKHEIPIVSQNPMSFCVLCLHSILSNAASDRQKTPQFKPK